METKLRRIGKRIDDFLYTKTLQLTGATAHQFAQLAGRYVQWGWWDEAAHAVQHAFKREPTCPLAHYTLGLIQDHQNNRAAALESFRSAMAYKLDDAQAHHHMAKVFAAAGQQDFAVQAYQHIIRVSPKNVSAYGVMAETYAKLKKYPEALAAYREVVRLKPTADAYAILGSAYARMGQYHEAVDAYEQAIRLEPGMAQTYNGLRAIYIKLDDFEKREKPALQQNQAPEKAQAYEKLKKEQTALELFKDKIRQKPGDAAAYYSIGTLYLELQLPQKALEFLKHAARLEPRSVSILTELATAYAYSGQNDPAIQTWARILKHDPRNVEVLTRMAQLHNRTGHFVEAMETVKQALRIKTQDASLYALLGEIQEKQALHADACKSYQQAARMNPGQASYQYALGMVYLRARQRNQAAGQYAILKTLDETLAKALHKAIWGTDDANLIRHTVRLSDEQD